MMEKKVFIINSSLQFNYSERSLVMGTEDISLLGENEARILLLLISHPHKAITRKEIYQYVWKARGVEVDDSSVTQAISTLRKSLGDSAKSPRYIMTEHRLGYKFIANVKSLDGINNVPYENDIFFDEIISENIDKDSNEGNKDISIKRKGLTMLPSIIRFSYKVVFDWRDIIILMIITIIIILILYELIG